MRIAFLLTAFTMEEQCVAALEYAHLSVLLLSHTVTIFVPSNYRQAPRHSQQVEGEFRNRFEVREFPSFSHLNAELARFDMAYSLERGEDTGRPPLPIPLAVHCTHVCIEEEAHGDAYIPMVPEINETKAEVVPCIMIRPMTAATRESIRVPDNGILVAYYGSTSAIDPATAIVAQALEQTQENHSVWMVIINSQALCTTQRVIPISHESDNQTKLMLVNAADAVIYTPELTELLQKSKDELTRGQIPIFMEARETARRLFEYDSPAGLYELLLNVKHAPRAQDKTYYLDQRSVMDRFQKHIIDPLKKTVVRDDTVETKEHTYTIKEGWLVPTPLHATAAGWQTVLNVTQQPLLINAPPVSGALVQTVIRMCAGSFSRGAHAPESSAPISIVVEENPVCDRLSPALIETIMEGRCCFYSGCPNVADYLRPANIGVEGHYVPIPVDPQNLTFKFDLTEAQAFLKLASPEGMSAALERLERLCKLTVNLDYRPERYAEHVRLCEEAQLHNVQRFPAANGKEYPVDHPVVQSLFTLTMNFVGGGKNPAGIIGCALSHYWIWKQAVERNEPILAMEDDVTFTPGATQRMAWLLHRLDQTEWDIVFVGYHRHEDNARAHGVPEDYLERTYSKLDLLPFNILTGFGTPADASGLHGGGTFGYIVSPRGAQKMIDVVAQRTIAWPADYFILDCGLNHGLEILTCAHPLVRSPKFGIDTDVSDIQQ
jgi:GR25 family glycosyltransferase involved in LPS biosynthesis